MKKAHDGVMGRSRGMQEGGGDQKLYFTPRLVMEPCCRSQRR